MRAKRLTSRPVVILTVVYLGTVIVPCAPSEPMADPGIGAAAHAMHAQTASATASSSHHHMAPHGPHRGEARNVVLVAPCECGCDAPGNPISRVRTQTNGLKALVPTWQPPVAFLSFSEAASRLIDPPASVIETVPIPS